jgi:hypothetical protein
METTTSKKNSTDESRVKRFIRDHKSGLTFAAGVITMAVGIVGLTKLVTKDNGLSPVGVVLLEEATTITE